MRSCVSGSGPRPRPSLVPGDAHGAWATTPAAVPAPVSSQAALDAWLDFAADERLAARHAWMPERKPSHYDVDLAPPTERLAPHEGDLSDLRPQPLEAAEDAGATSSLLRRPGKAATFVRGSAVNVPFLPGGVSASASAPVTDEDDAEAAERAARGLAGDAAALIGEVPGLGALLTAADVGGGAPGDSLPAGELDPLGRNPEGLLDPFAEAAQRDRAALRDAQRAQQAAWSAGAAPAAASVDYASLFDDDELLDSSSGEEESSDDEDVETPAEEVKAAEAVKAAEEAKAADDDEDVDVDRLLAQVDAAVQQRTTRQRPKGGKDKKRAWARTERLDVSDWASVVPRPAYRHPFELDDFQKQAVARIERGECVFVAAHTSAGKTAVAEYAIAKAAQTMTRCVYTSPIKKFRDFKDRFDDVGIITGDVQVNPQASCLIMTTEILRSMLYKGADLVRDISWVIFDEVHYVNDSERGVVWEEVIIMLPDHVNMVFLSATTPNTIEFSDWIGRTKRKPVYVVSTTRRPVPLQHYVQVGKHMVKLVDADGTLLRGGYDRAKEICKQAEAGKTKGGGGGGQRGGARRPGQSTGTPTQWTQFVRSLEQEQLLPCVVFCFSKKRCEANAEALQRLDLTDGGEKSAIHVFYQGALARLRGSDARLPQVLGLAQLLRRGIGVHHGGLLPILKEVVELLFARGLVKLLFATETFAMGVNMPARTVVFSGTRKHDGKGFRDLNPGEYTQMSGRAGRRGLDRFGTVVMACWDSVPELANLRQMLAGMPSKLESQFRLTYNMMLNLLRAEDLTVEDMLKRSFSEFHNQRAVGAADLQPLMDRGRRRLDALRAEGAAEPCVFGGAREVDEYYALTERLGRVSEALSDACGGAVLSRGKTLTVAHRGMVNVPGIVLERHSENTFYALLLLPEGFEAPAEQAPAAAAANPEPEPAPKQPTMSARDAAFLRPGALPAPPAAERAPEYDVAGYRTTPQGRVFAVRLLSTRHVVEFGKAKNARFDAQAVLGGDAAAGAQLAGYLAGLPQPLAAVHAGKDLRLNSVEVAEAQDEARRVQERRAASKCHACPRLGAQFELEERAAVLGRKLDSLGFALSNENLALFPDSQQRLEVLRHLGYVDAAATVQLKGRVACEVSTCDELIFTEVLFENVLEPLSAAECVGLLSAMVCQEKGGDAAASATLTPALERARQQSLRIAAGLGALQMEAGLDVELEDYVAQLNFAMSEVAYHWARGVPFFDVCELSTAHAGSIVRCLTRTSDTCREVRQAARVIGDPGLYRKMEEAEQAIKRDIVFATSLYLS